MMQGDRRNMQPGDCSPAGCCDVDAPLELLRQRQTGTLYGVLGINTVMFVVISTAALYSMSSALLSDALDNLGDALTYGLSLYAVSRSGAVKARIAIFKGGLIFLAACGVGAASDHSPRRTV